MRTAGDGKYLLAADAGSNQVLVLRIGADGSLTPVTGSPFSSLGVEPDSIAVNDGLVYVSNTGAGGTNYTGFTLSPDGRLHPIPGSTVTLPEIRPRRRPTRRRQHEAGRDAGPTPP